MADLVKAGKVRYVSLSEADSETTGSVAEVAKEIKATPVQVTLAWLRSHDGGELSVWKKTGHHKT
jgi:aryl-alcohol dehydrogenase-like predicted oxidoreductase